MYNFFDVRQCVSKYVWREFLDDGSFFFFFFFTECFDLEVEHKSFYKRINQLQWVYNGGTQLTLAPLDSFNIKKGKYTHSMCSREGGNLTYVAKLPTNPSRLEINDEEHDFKNSSH